MDAKYRYLVNDCGGSVTVPFCTCSRKCLSQRFTASQFVCCLFIIWAIMPLTNRNFIVAIPIIFMWFLTAFYNGSASFPHSDIKLVFGILFWFVYEVVLKLIGISTAGIGNFASHFCYWFCVILWLYYRTRESWFLHFLEKFIVAIFVINTLWNIGVYALHPEYVDNITLIDQQTDGGAARLNIAMTSFSSALALLVLMLLYGGIKNHRRNGTVAIMIFLLLILQMGRGLTAGTLFAGIIFIFFTYILFIKRISLTLKNTILLGCAGVGALLGFIVFYNPEFLYVLIPSRRAAARFVTLFSGTGTGFTRIMLMMMSLSTFVSSPKNFVMGIGYHLVSTAREDFTLAEKIGVGQHSFICDSLARYGIIGFFIVGWLYISFYKKLVHRLDKADRSFCFGLLALWLVNNLVGSTYVTDVAVVQFLFIPISLQLSTKRHKNE